MFVHIKHISRQRNVHKVCTCYTQNEYYGMAYNCDLSWDAEINYCGNYKSTIIPKQKIKLATANIHVIIIIICIT